MSKDKKEAIVSTVTINMIEYDGIHKIELISSENISSVKKIVMISELLNEIIKDFNGNLDLVLKLIKAFKTNSKG